MIDSEKFRLQLLKLMNDWDVEVMESTDQELVEIYDQIMELAEGGEGVLGNRDYAEMHTAQILEVMIRWEMRIRSEGEELPGVPYDPILNAAEARLSNRLTRLRAEANPN
ncbi:MAG TPA: hypothetical protein VIM11_04315 [Tepidisphaeraceae bacterium]|jgi:hypothetical protein